MIPRSASLRRRHPIGSTSDEGELRGACSEEAEESDEDLETPSSATKGDSAQLDDDDGRHALRGSKGKRTIADVNAQQRMEGGRAPRSGHEAGPPQGDGKRGRGRPAAAKVGQKKCIDCNEVKDIDQFRLGHAVCTSPCLRCKENVKRACILEGKTEWFEEQYADKKLWQKLKRWYLQRLPPDSRIKRGKAATKAFPILTYMRAARTERQQVRDGIIDMMHLGRLSIGHQKAITSRRED